MSYDKSKDRNRRALRTLNDVRDLSQHACAVPGCGEIIPRHLLMCLPHWKRVPNPLRDAVLRTWRTGGAGTYLAARKAAIESVTKNP